MGTVERSIGLESGRPCECPFRPSLRAKRSNPRLKQKESWIASSQTLLAMTKGKLCSGRDQNHIEHRSVVQRGGEQNEGMPDRILKPQPLPGMEDHTE